MCDLVAAAGVDLYGRLDIAFDNGATIQHALTSRGHDAHLRPA